MIMTILPAMKANAANPEWMFHKLNYDVGELADDGEYMWIGLLNGGIYKFHKDTQKIVDTMNFEENDWADGKEFAKDKEGVLWIASTVGLIKYDGVNEIRYTTDNSGLPHNSITSLIIDQNDHIWASTIKGLAKYDGANWTVYNTSNSGIPNDTIAALALDKSDNIWIGTDSRGLAKFDRKEWTIYNENNSGLPSSYIFTLKFDKSGNLWIGTYKGLTKFDGANWTVYNTSNSKIPDNYVSTIAIDSSNNLWFCNYIGGQSYGLVKFDGVNNWTFYNSSNSGLRSDDIHALTFDIAGNLWIGVSSSDIEKTGICIFKEGGVILSTDEDNIFVESVKPYVYPNPVKDKFQIMNHDYNSYTILDLTGQEIQSGLLSNNEIYVGNIPNGIYFLNLKSGINLLYLKFLKIQ
jgi:ligand-binding sensor domain-containing protein